MRSRTTGTPRRRSPGCRWRWGLDLGGRYGTERYEFFETVHSSSIIYSGYTAVYTDLEVPCGCCTLVGGVRVDEPGADLAVALAVASAVRGVALGGDGGRPLACFGELGLTGELRSVAHADRRLAEAAKFGLRPVINPDTHPPDPTLRAVLSGVLGGRPRGALAA